MKKSFNTLVEWNDYLAHVMRNANHHGQKVIWIIPTVAGMLTSLPQLRELRAFEKKGDIKRWIWFKCGVRDIEYNMCYDYTLDKISLRTGRKVIHQFDNNSTNEDIHAAFQSLAV